jgi:FkbM family methyltransferase
MTARCRDTDALPKVRDAGTIRQEPDGTRVQIMYNGLRVLADGYCGPWMTDLIARCRGHHEPQEERVFHEVLARLRPDATMLELGGYWAFYSLSFLQNHPRRRAVVIEPDPGHLAVGRRNAELNRLSPEFIQGFLGAEPGPPRPFQTEDSGVVEIPCVSVPQILAERNIGTLDLLHCDAQGAELPVLESCAELLRAGRIGWVFVSTHVWYITGDPLTHQRCLSLLQSLGATVVAEHDVYESFSGDGLIVARFGPLPPGWQDVRLSYNRYSTSLFRNPLYDFAASRKGG